MNRASRSRSASKFPGSWKRTGPAFGPRSFSLDSINAIEFAHVAFSRFQCVMNFDAFHATARGRAGVYVHPNWLVYSTVGIAWLGFERRAR